MAFWGLKSSFLLKGMTGLRWKSTAHCGRTCPVSRLRRRDCFLWTVHNGLGCKRQMQT